MALFLLSELYRKLLCCPPREVIFFCESTSFGGNYSTPGGYLFLFQNYPGGLIYPGGRQKIPTACTHNIHTYTRDGQDLRTSVQREEGGRGG